MFFTVRGHVGCSSEEDTVIMAPVPAVKSEFTPKSEWTSSIGNGVGHFFSQLTPDVAYGKVFVGSRDGEVKALDPENGKTLWSIDLEDETIARLSGGIVAAYSALFIGSENGEVIALEAETGEVKWRSTVNGEVLARPVVDSNLVIVNTSRGILTALDAETGEEKWNISTEVPNLTLRGDSSPVAVAGGVFWVRLMVVLLQQLLSADS